MRSMPPRTVLGPGRSRSGAVFLPTHPHRPAGPARLPGPAERCEDVDPAESDAVVDPIRGRVGQVGEEGAGLGAAGERPSAQEGNGTGGMAVFTMFGWRVHRADGPGPPDSPNVVHEGGRRPVLGRPYPATSRGWGSLAGLLVRRRIIWKRFHGAGAHSEGMPLWMLAPAFEEGEPHLVHRRVETQVTMEALHRRGECEVAR